MIKIYQLFFVDEYNNMECVGWYKNLDDSIESLNSRINLYGDGKYKLKKGDLGESMGTFESYVYLPLAEVFEEDEAYDDFQSAEVRGIVYYFTEDEAQMIEKIFMKD